MDSLIYHTVNRVESTGLIIDTKVYVDLEDGVTVYQYLYRGPKVISTSCVQLSFAEFGRFITSVGAFLWTIRDIDPSLVKFPKSSDWDLLSDDILNMPDLYDIPDMPDMPDPKTDSPDSSDPLDLEDRDNWELGDDLDWEL
jgi:hypothetical protein